MSAPVVICAGCDRERRHQARGLCHGCYSAAYRDGTVEQYPPRRRKAPAETTTHGTTRGWAWHRRNDVPICPACRHAQNRYKQWRDLRRSEGKPGYVDAAPVVAHVERLRTLGMSLRSIGSTAGVGNTTLHKVMTREVRTVRAITAEKVLAVTGPPEQPRDADDETFVPRAGTLRRIQALQCLGWRHSDITNTSGVRSHLLLSQSGPYVTVRTRAAIARAYDELSMSLGPSERTRRRAAVKGWLPPLAWNDEDLDNPLAWPSFGADDTAADEDLEPDDLVVERLVEGADWRTLHATRAERLAAYTTATRRGESSNSAAGRLGIRSQDIAAMRRPA